MVLLLTLRLYDARKNVGFPSAFDRPGGNKRFEQSEMLKNEEFHPDLFRKNIDKLREGFHGKYVILVLKNGENFLVYSGESGRDVCEKVFSEGFEPADYGFVFVY